MDLKDLRSFLAVAELSSISRAAEKLFLSQPAMSRQIHALETELGVLLFARGQKQLHLTLAGEVLQDRAKALVEQADDTEMLMKQVAKGDGGSLRIAATPMVMRTSVAPAIAAFRETSPNVDIQLTEVDSDSWVSLIEQGTVDLGIGPDAPMGRSLMSTPLFTPKMCAVLRFDHPLASKQELSLDDLVHERGLVLKNIRLGRQKGEVVLSTSFLRFASTFESLHAETLITLAAGGLGVAILSEYLVEHASMDMTRLRVIPIVVDGRQTEATLVLAWHRRLASSDAARRFMAILRDEVVARTSNNGHGAMPAPGQAVSATG